METNRRPKRLRYTEARTVNIGDYESFKCELSYDVDVEMINETEATVRVWASDAVDVGDEKEAFEKSVKQAMSRVKKVLDMREADVRIRSAKFTEHDTSRKGLFMGLMDMKNWYKKQDKFSMLADEIDEYEDE